MVENIEGISFGLGERRGWGRCVGFGRGEGGVILVTWFHGAWVGEQRHQSAALAKIGRWRHARLEEEEGGGRGSDVGLKAGSAGELLKPRGRLGPLGQHAKKEEKAGLGREEWFLGQKWEKRIWSGEMDCKFDLGF
jgi:hypothetical protein